MFDRKVIKENNFKSSKVICLESGETNSNKNSYKKQNYSNIYSTKELK